MPSSEYRAITLGLRSTIAAVTGRVASYPNRSRVAWIAASRRSIRRGPNPYRAPMSSARRTRFRCPFPLAATLRAPLPLVAMAIRVIPKPESARSGSRIHPLEVKKRGGVSLDGFGDPSAGPRDNHRERVSGEPPRPVDDLLQYRGNVGGALIDAPRTPLGPGWRRPLY